MYVLDSSALIEVIENHPKAEVIEQLLKDAPLITTSISMHEVLAGASSEKQCFVLEGLFSTMRVLSHDAEAARIGAAIEQDLSHSGKKIGRADVLIAAICIVHDAALVTLDADFKNIKKLKLAL